ncbi:PAB-dependent poly(A)-specific ribonuclease subunit 3 [Dispira simplex]|nr:PAB-dependent poly(A)-specific ribonuclease subunit 3 [Dispira simplex]
MNPQSPIFRFPRKSAAIPIVKPTITDEPADTAPVETSPAPPTCPISPSGNLLVSDKPRPCRNVIIFGSCKYEGKGCKFSHPSDEQPTPSTASVAAMEVAKSPDVKGKLPNPNSPIFTPKKYQGRQPPLTSMLQEAAMDLSSPQASPSKMPVDLHLPDSLVNLDLTAEEDTNPFYDKTAEYPDDADSMVSPTMPKFLNPTDPPPPPLVGPEDYLESLRRLPREPLNYHLYTAPPLSFAHRRPNQKSAHDFFINRHLHQFLTERNIDIAESLSSTSGLPDQVHHYHSLVTLAGDSHDPLQAHYNTSFETAVYKGTSSQDGLRYTLRRIKNFVLANENAMSVVNLWRTIRHPNLVSLHEAFTIKAFGDNSVVFVYDYIPLATTLYQHYFSTGASPAMGGSHYNGGNPASLYQVWREGGSTSSTGSTHQTLRITESLLWSFTTQLTSALHKVHSNGLAIRSLSVNHVLIDKRNRLYIDRTAIMDFMVYGPQVSSTIYQQEDLRELGIILLQLACGNVQAHEYLDESLNFIQRHYSGQFKQLLFYLLVRRDPGLNSEDILRFVGPRMFEEVDSCRMENDDLTNELGRELENARLVRLLCKLGFINERPEFNMDSRWSETGDRYLLKLFRDYVFHQVDERGRPVLDLAHVLSCLNKLDAGVSERIVLTSRDEQSCLIVSYRDLKECIESSLRELR